VNGPYGAQWSSMTDELHGDFWWCLVHHRVETGEQRCKATDRLGPYKTESQAQQAMQTVEERNAAYDAESGD